ncbi:MAG TPA: phasin family protein [Roseiflexaceae bacterium]|nr:phasin family protein [Roseiflexaceae bacterium]
MATTTKRAPADKTNGDATVAEEVEVVVTEVEDAAAKAGNSLVEGLRKLVLASLGAVAMTRDEVEAFVDKLVERGQLAQKDGEKLVKELRSRVRDSRPQVQKVGESVEQRIEDFLNRLNIPSKRDIDDLSTKVAQLSARVDELRKQQS